MATTNLGNIEAPARTLVEIRRDLMDLERELAHHALWARAMGDEYRHGEISDCQPGIHESAITLGIITRERAR